MEYPSNLYGILDEFLHDDRTNIVLDIFYHEGGHPKQLHDIVGGTAASQLLRESLFDEIRKRNSPKRIWPISAYGYAIEHHNENCSDFILTINGVMHRIIKKTIEIKVRTP